MPLLENELTKLVGLKCYSNFYLSHGYCQLPLHADIQNFQCFLKLDGVFTPNGVLYGTTNGVAHIQSTLSEEISGSLKEKLLQ